MTFFFFEMPVCNCGPVDESAFEGGEWTLC